MLSGKKQLTLDDKGRMAIPAKHREYLRETSCGRVVVTLGVDDCLLIYPLAEWRPVAERVAALPNTDPGAQSLKRLLIGHAEECDLDGQGRVLLSSTLRKLARIGKQVVLVGQVHRFELWDQEHWDGQFDDLRASARTVTHEVSY